ncbi:hypothetical protein E3N88_23960 [Mikania micrantha]|uniref:Uncharacterized protein n=1 Tax=Mikania micrantha TaxID=192012 RepID=A0A5N6NFV0_9ASTR|nr:hypothetical protein E3N88_23960 [Mikania micrantha]
MADAAVITTTNIPTNPSTITMVNFPSSLKLTSTNYLSWKTQIEAFLQGLDLYKFIDGTHPPPLPTLKPDGTSTPHADFNKWYRQDRLLFGALVGTLSAPIVSLINHATSSAEAWKILATTYASPTRGHIKQLQHRLKNLSKSPTQSITEYMHAIKELVDQLAILGKTMDAEDVSDLILNGLDQKTYRSVIDDVHARDSPIQFHELHEKLINHELTISPKPPDPTPSHQPLTAFAAHTRQPSKPWNVRPTTGLLPTPQPNPNTPSKPYLGKCQWCFTKGHSLTTCYHFKKAHPHISLPTYPKPNQNSKPLAHFASSPLTGSDQPWLYDSGASHHVTNDLSSLSLHAPYDGTDDLIIGDGPSNQSAPHPSSS